jgi:hypothetical protein
MKILLFVLLAYGITNIAVFGSIFENWRAVWNKVNPKFFGKLFSCPMCLSFYVGGILSYIFYTMGYSTPFLSYGVTNLPLLIFLDACFSSGCTWILHNIEECFESGFYKKD